MENKIQELIKYVSDNYEELLKLTLKQLAKNFFQQSFEIKLCEGTNSRNRLDQHHDDYEWNYGLVINGVEIYNEYGCSCNMFLEGITTKEVLDSILGEIQPHTCKVNEKDLYNWNYIDY